MSSNSYTLSQIKLLSSVFLFLLVLSLIFTLVKFIFFIKGAKNSEDKMIMNFIIIGISALFHLSSTILCILESDQIDKIVKKLNEINRENLEIQRSSNICQNKTANSTLPENNLDDPNFKKEDTIVIVCLGKGKTENEDISETINTKEKGRDQEKHSKNIINISQNKITDMTMKEENKKIVTEKEKDDTHKQNFFRNESQIDKSIYKPKKTKLSCSQEIILSLSSNRENLKSTEYYESKNNENLDES